MKSTIITILVFFTILVLDSCSTSTKKINVQKIGSDIDSLLFSHEKFNGVILITKGEEVIYSKVNGFSDMEKRTPLKATDQFVIGSISKQVTAVLILKEFENGNLELHIPIANYLSDITQSWVDTVTIHHLLTHTHGISELNQPLDFVVGTKFSYSQLGYELLAQVLEGIKEKPFDEISMQFFQENGLNNTFHPDIKGYKDLVKGYIEQGDKSMIYEKNSLKNYVSAGSFISNATDLNLWSQLLYSGQLVELETLSLMRTRYATRMHPIFDEVEYGYGLLFKMGEENIQIGALGYAPAFVSANYYYPKTGISVIVLGNVAKDLDDFRKTFYVHLEVMKIVRTLQVND